MFLRTHTHVLFLVPLVALFWFWFWWRLHMGSAIFSFAEVNAMENIQNLKSVLLIAKSNFKMCLIVFMRFYRFKIKGHSRTSTIMYVFITNLSGVILWKYMNMCKRVEWWWLVIWWWYVKCLHLELHNRTKGHTLYFVMQTSPEINKKTIRISAMSKRGGGLRSNFVHRMFHHEGVGGGWMGLSVNFFKNFGRQYLRN